MVNKGKTYYTFDKNYGFIVELEKKDSPLNDDLQTSMVHLDNGWTEVLDNKEIFESEDEALEARNKYLDKESENISKDIHSIEELISFAMHSEGDMPIVQEVVRMKAKELGLDSHKI